MSAVRPRRVVVVTGTRADFGLLRWLIEDLSARPDIALDVVATGMHLSPVFGRTIEEVQAVCPVSATVEVLLSSDTGVGTAKAVGLGVISFAEAFDRLDPDVVVVLGDRFEILAAAQSALLLRRPVAHIHGGEVTTGAFDDSIRHAITKMAHLHFVAAEPYRQRVLQLGERPDRVYTVGAPGLDHLSNAALLSRQELADSLDTVLEPPLLAVTYHPVTTQADPVGGVDALITALGRRDTGTVVITMPNADPGGLDVMRRLRTFADSSDRVHAFTNLGSSRYLSLMAHADAVVGNSSSGIIEAPALGVPTVNIGSRQAGRLRAESVIDCEPTAEAITSAIEQAVARGVREPDQAALPYGGGGASHRIAEVLANVPLDDLTAKPFIDLPRSDRP